MIGTRSTTDDARGNTAAGDTPPPDLVLQEIGHDHGTLTALEGIDLTVAASSFVAVVGPSGCGKSTLLRLLAGLDLPSRGTIRIGDTDPTVLRRARQVGWMAQRPALLPWQTAHDNVALARTIRHQRPAGPEVDELLDLVGLDDFRDARPHQLSGGMQQRVALARTLAQDAPLWLMDEPLAALDELTREDLARDLLAIWRQRRPTVVWVTHHLTEAVSLADRVVVLGPRPATVVADLAIDLDRPRDPTTPAFQDVVRDAREHLSPRPGRRVEQGRERGSGGTASRTREQVAEARA